MPLIEVKNLEKIYESEETPTVALRGINLTIEKGEFIAIIGPSGSGKSTLLQILGLLDRPTKGSYFFKEKSIEEYSDDEQAVLRNKALGFIFQSFNLLPRASVLDNIMLPLAYSTFAQKQWKERAKKQISAVGLSHREEFEPAQLSGGERQRVAIARALVTDPEIIFADEPTGNLDSVSGKKIIDILRKLHDAEGHTIVLITHDKSIARTAERIVCLRDGTIVWDGKAKDYTDNN